MVLFSTLLSGGEFKREHWCDSARRLVRLPTLSFISMLGHSGLNIRMGGLCVVLLSLRRKLTTVLLESRAMQDHLVESHLEEKII